MINPTNKYTHLPILACLRYHLWTYTRCYRTLVQEAKRFCTRLRVVRFESRGNNISNRSAEPHPSRWVRWLLFRSIQSPASCNDSLHSGFNGRWESWASFNWRCWSSWTSRWKGDSLQRAILALSWILEHLKFLRMPCTVSQDLWRSWDYQQYVFSASTLVINALNFLASSKPIST